MNIIYDEKLLGTVAFSNGCLCSKELAQREHRHFHPSGDTSPSKDDIRLTDRMQQACELIGIPLTDHIIVGTDNRQYFSFREKGELKNPFQVFATDVAALNWNQVAERGGKR